MTSRKRKNWLKYIIIVVVLVGLAFGGFMIWKHWQTGEVREEDRTMQPAETKLEEKVKEEVEIKEDEAKAKEESEVDVGKKKVEQFDGGDPNKKEEITGVITYAGVSGEKLIVRVNIDQYLADGVCKLNLSRDGGVIYEETAEVVDSAATATCKGFNVPAASLGSGKINIKILVTSGGKTGTIEGGVSL